MPKIDFINDEAGKPVGIYEHIGVRPILAFGNSDHDMQRVQYTTDGKGRRLGLFVHHTDADCEFAYDRKGMIWSDALGLSVFGAVGCHAALQFCSIFTWDHLASFCGLAGRKTIHIISNNETKGKRRDTTCSHLILTAESEGDGLALLAGHRFHGEMLFSRRKA